jgi:hypothetical protein
MRGAVTGAGASSTTIIDATDVPHLTQKRASFTKGVPHWLQNMVASVSLGFLGRMLLHQSTSFC